jgi:NAD(P)-dependent dehydrogenase (short-subunit alcohol dehydrogenase family)
MGNNNMSMQHLCVLITGAGDSVGRVTAEKFMAAGASVHICDVREEAVQATLDANPGMGGTCCNVGDSVEVSRLFDEALGRMGRVDILVNCVGIAGPHAALENITDEDWQTSMQVNATGMFYTMKHAIPGMKERRFGAIINFSSASTVTRLPNRTAYVVSKYAVEGLTKNASRELGPYNVRCNAILPGGINNDRLNMVFQRVARDKGMPIEEFEKEALKYVSMRTKIEPEELADTVLYLASDKAPHITGQLLEVSGGAEWEE